VLDVVAQGAVPIGHTAAYYYIGKTPATAFGTTVPFGLTAQQQNAWLYGGGGLELTQKLFAEKFNVLPLAGEHWHADGGLASARRYQHGRRSAGVEDAHCRPGGR
jgi:TRAP-type mannitol/chloroaromatic compound transport system substrate-binding protein